MGVELPPGLSFVPARRLFADLPEATLHLVGRAIACVEFEETHRFVGVARRPLSRGPFRCRQNPESRSSACASVLAVGSRYIHVSRRRLSYWSNAGTQLLLARGPNFPPGRFSEIDGIVEEIGESLEQAARREVREEVGVTIAELRYFASQPWPFGTRAWSRSTPNMGGELRADGVEIVEARWFERDALPLLPPPISIARKEIRGFSALTQAARRLWAPAPGRLLLIHRSAKTAGNNVPPESLDASSDLGQSEIRRMTRECERVSGINLGQGICDLPTLPLVRDGAIAAIQENRSTYSFPEGTLELRRAIAEKLERENGIRRDPMTEIVVTLGATGAFTSTLMALLDPGDGIILFEPYYGYHVNTALLAGVVPQFVPLELPSLALSETDLRRAIQPNTRAIVVCTPGNPSGKMFTRAELDMISRVAREHDLLVITDEMYEYFRYDERSHISPATMPGLEDRTVTIMGLSKTFSITGWRLGYAVASAELARPISLVNDIYYVCAPTPLQLGAAAGFRAPTSYFRFASHELPEQARPNLLRARGGAPHAARARRRLLRARRSLAHELQRRSGRPRWPCSNAPRWPRSPGPRFFKGPRAIGFSGFALPKKTACSPKRAPGSVQTPSEKKQFVVPAELAGRPLDGALKALGALSWGKARELIERGKIRLGGKVVTDGERRVREGETIELDPAARKLAASSLLERSAILYFDPHVVVVNKPAGMSTVPYETGERGTLDQAVMSLLPRSRGKGPAGDARRGATARQRDERRPRVRPHLRRQKIACGTSFACTACIGATLPSCTAPSKGARSAATSSKIAVTACAARRSTAVKRARDNSR